MNAASCKKPWIDPPSRALEPPGHHADHLVFEPGNILGLRQPIDLGGVPAGIDRASHQRHAARCRRMIILRHHGDRGQHRHRRLADAHDMAARPEEVEELDHMLDILVEAEAAGGDRHVAGVVPVGDKNIVVPQQHLDRAAQQCGEMAGHRRHQQHLRLLPVGIFSEMNQARKRRFEHHLVGHAGQLVADHHVIDRKGRPDMRGAGLAEHLQPGIQIAQPDAVRRLWSDGPQQAARRAGHHPQGIHNIGLRLVHLIDHTAIPAA